MRLVLATLLPLLGDGRIQAWMGVAVYPVLLGVLIVASLGIPIPEDVPLIAAGVILKTEPEAASWVGVILVALIGIMSGDLVLYSAGKRWGRDVVKHRLVRSLVTPERFDKMVEKFHKHGTWMCFFGRFFMGVRAAMCVTAGATRFPYWKFFLADFAGALLSVPFFVALGYFFADMIPTLKKYIADAQGILLAAVVLFVLAYVYYEFRVRRKTRLANEEYLAAHPGEAAPVAQDSAAPVAQEGAAPEARLKAAATAANPPANRASGKVSAGQAASP